MTGYPGGDGNPAGAPLPERPTRERAKAAEAKRFDGKLAERDDQEGYVRIAFGNSPARVTFGHALSPLGTPGCSAPARERRNGKHLDPL